MSVARRLYDVLRSRLHDAADAVPGAARFRDRVSEQVRRTWEETQRAYREGREGGAGWDRTPGGGASTDSNGSGRGPSGGWRASAGARRGSSWDPRRDPELASWYANLEVPYGSDLETVTRAWKRLARVYHPDRYHNDPQRREHATELIKGINNAYEQLRRRLDPQRASP